MPGICFRCKEFVHAAEEKLALGSSWHLECFTCAICNSTLDSTSISESSKGKEIYCRSCYQKHYAIPGYGFGPTKPTLLSVLPAKDEGSRGGLDGGNGNCPCCTCGRPSTPPEEPFVPPPSRQGQVFASRLPTPRHYAKQVVLPTSCECCQCEKGDGQVRTKMGNPPPRVPAYNQSYLRGNDAWKPTRAQQPGQPGRKGEEECGCGRRDGGRKPGQSPRPGLGCQAYSRKESSMVHLAQKGQCQRCCSPSPPPEPKPGRQLPSGCHCAPKSANPRHSATRAGKSPSRNVPVCQKCGGAVFHAEQVMGYRGVYHVRCFVCCSCGKTLDSTTVNEHRGELYCKGCYKREYGTVGVGYGIGAGTLQTP